MNLALPLAVAAFAKSLRLGGGRANDWDSLYALLYRQQPTLARILRSALFRAYVFSARATVRNYDVVPASFLHLLGRKGAREK